MDAEYAEMVIETEPAGEKSRGDALTALSIDDDGLYGAWRTARPRSGESCRWERTTTEWVSVQLGEDVEMGQAVVLDSRGQRQCVPSYEDALRLARAWTL